MRLIIGTANLDSNYGTYVGTSLTVEECVEIFRSMQMRDIPFSFETSSLYEGFRHTHYLSALSDNLYLKMLPDHFLRSDAYDFIKVLKSKVEVDVNVMLHKIPKGNLDSITECCETMIDERLVSSFGVSLYDANELLLLESFKDCLSFIQLPLNILDQRALSDESRLLYEKFNVKIQARSVFLQGTLLCDPRLGILSKAPESLRLAIENLWERNEFQEVGVLRECLSCFAGLDFVDSAVFGFAGVRQFEQFLPLWERSLSSGYQYPKPCEYDEAFDPRFWSLGH